MTTIESPSGASPAPEDETDDYIDVDALYAHLEEAKTEEARRYWRRRIVEKSLPLADHIAYRFINRGESREDLLQVARLALVKAVHRYDRDKGRFVSFVVPTVLGEIRRHFRDNTWGVHVPRRYQESTLAIRAAVDALSQRTGRMPTVQELASELDVTPEEIRESEEARQAYRPLSLDEDRRTEDGGPRLRSSIGGVEDAGFARVEDLTVLAELVRELPDRERAVLRMRFYECRKQRDIAASLGVSQVHVSRLLRATLDQLRIRMCTDGAAIFAAVSLAACHT
ncbi:SigB/SigF/SigG family RNA polymerase sigma factor [Mycobacterium sp. 852002-51961_SCH5331710]|uniref:SigB/SigF/SigG family RNA polymerase sigma factor n=1 Tax=Mycobacterium sp. 852002-51961_SCH5331710 TaxID=1834105 RepID=UPI0007FDA59D|nr:SigB/SigF/SigG family RNA polymerase sigma factor [Mycobacterium sp. 852002-51961_SCH5331710]OBB35738.1 hypothetical protein A5752_19150 [Mycobacterium sp. 852002-51961_SCH5331710]